MAEIEMEFEETIYFKLLNKLKDLWSWECMLGNLAFSNGISK